MNKKIFALLSGIVLTTSLINIEVSAEVLNFQDNQLDVNYENTNNNSSNENVIVREFIALSTNEFARAGDACELVLLILNVLIKVQEKFLHVIQQLVMLDMVILIHLAQLDVYKECLII